MRKTTAVLSTVAAIAALTTGVLAAPQGMAPYPGQTGATATPPPPPPGMEPNAPPASNGAPGYPPPATAKPLKPAGCVWTRTIRDWSHVDDRTMIVREGSKRYLVTFNGTCRDSRWEYGMAVDSRYGSCLREGDRVTFGSPFGYTRGPMPFPCYIKKIEELPKQT